MENKDKKISNVVNRIRCLYTSDPLFLFNSELVFKSIRRPINDYMATNMDIFMITILNSNIFNKKIVNDD